MGWPFSRQLRDLNYSNHLSMPTYIKKQFIRGGCGSIVQPCLRNNLQFSIHWVIQSKYSFQLHLDFICETMDQISMTMNYTLGKISNSISGDDGLLIRFLETRLPAMDTRSLSFLIAPTLLYSIWYLASFVFPALLMSKKPKVLPYRVPGK